METFDLIVVAAGTVIGLFAGTVINAISLRLPADLSAIGAPPCHACGEPAGAGAFVPLAQLPCPRCQAGPRWHKAGVEAASAALVAMSLWIHGLTLQGISVAVFCLILLTILKIDWQHHLIFTITIIPGIAAALLFAALDSWSALVSALIAAGGAGLVFTLFFVLALIIYRQQALGLGDIFLVMLIGAMTGTERVVPAILLGMVLAAVGGVFLIVIGRRTRRDYIPYGAYLCLGAIIVLLLLPR